MVPGSLRAASSFMLFQAHNFTSSGDEVCDEVCDGVL
jgi:hypothetical protein